MSEEELVQLIANEVVARIRATAAGKRMVMVNTSARHIHLSQAHVEALFGPGHTLTNLKDLGQPGQFAATEQVTIHGPGGSIPKVRVLGPARGDTQLEISLTDGFALGVNAPIRLSGNIAGTPGITVEGPRGGVTIDQGVIVAARHIHLHTSDAERFGLVNGQKVRVRTTGARPLTFEDVVARVSDQFAAEMHVDTDEGNAGAIKNGDMVEILP